MSEQVNKEQPKDANQETITELPEEQLDEVAGGGERNATGPVYPAAWEQTVRPEPDSKPPSGSYGPLIYGVIEEDAGREGGGGQEGEDG